MGQAGNVPCVNCLNVRNRWCTLKPGEQYYWDPDVARRKAMERNHIDIIIQRISDAGTIGERKRVQTATGMNYTPTGIFFNAYLMQHVLDPTSNYVRDWMHTFVSNGVAGTHIACVCVALEEANIPIAALQVYTPKSMIHVGRGKKPSDLYF